VSSEAEPNADGSSDPLDAVDWPVRTERLLLRRHSPDDEEAIWAYKQLPEVCEWLGWTPRDRADYDERMAAQSSPSVVVECDGVVIGDIGITIGDAWAQREVSEAAAGTQAELGWVFAPWAHGHGYATEAVRAVIGLCFGPLGLRRVTAGAFAANEPSWRLMERVGMRRESRTKKESLHRDHGWLDGVEYAILAEEFHAD
jgi:RimJ/RimL family protein N-acetyltransferase